MSSFLTATSARIDRPARSGRVPRILDGGFGLELEGRGCDCTLPLWSAKVLLENPRAVQDLHSDYIRAGAEIITANTFRTTRHTLKKVGLEEKEAELVSLSVRLAKAAIELTKPRSGFQIAGSLAPLEDCFEPNQTPADDVLEKEHIHNSATLAWAGVDLILVETQNSRREALIATRAALSTGKPVWVSLVPKSPTELFDGSDLLDTASELSELGAEMILVNCCSLQIAGSAFDNLHSNLRVSPHSKGGLRGVGLYPNNFPEPVTPSDFADWSKPYQSRASVIGGCCGIGVEHIAKLATQINSLHIPKSTSL